jgi:transcriptional regulator with XRE-family HTH domain
MLQNFYKGGELVVYDRVKALCDERGLSISQLETMAGLGNGTIGGWRVSVPAVDTVKRVADALGITVNDLIEGIDFPERRKQLEH